MKQQGGELLLLCSFQSLLMTRILENDLKPQYYSPYPAFCKGVTNYGNLDGNPKLFSITSILRGTLKT